MDIFDRLERHRNGDLGESYRHGASTDLDNSFIVIEQGQRRMTKRQRRLSSHKTTENIEGNEKIESRRLSEEGWAGQGRHVVTGEREGETETKFQRLCFAGGSSEDTCKLRAQCVDDYVGYLDRRVAQCMNDADIDVFEALTSMVYRGTRAALESGKHGVSSNVEAHMRHGMERIPTGLVFANGVHSADHTGAFSALKRYMEGRGCKVALLSPSCFVSSRNICSVLSRIISQISDTDTLGSSHDPSACCTMDDLVEWYQSLSLATSGGEGMKAPIAIIVESLEMTDSEMLQDLITIMSERFREFPHVLLLGLTTTDGSLFDALPHQLVDRSLVCLKFEMASSMQRLEMFVDRILLGPWHGVVFDNETISTLWRKFFLHNFTINSIIHGLKLAAVEHIRRHPCPNVILLGMSHDNDIREIVSKMDLNQLRFLLGESNSKSSKETKKRKPMEEMVIKSYSTWCSQWDRWRLGVKWFVKAGKFVGLSGAFSYWKIFRDAQGADFKAKSLNTLREKLSSSLNGISIDNMKHLHEELLEIYHACAQSSEFFPPSVSNAVTEMDQALQKDIHSDSSPSKKQKASKFQKSNNKEDDNMENKKKERFYGKESRKAMLLCCSTIDKEVPLSPTAGGFSRVWPQTFIKHVCEMITEIPTDHKMAHSFCCGLKNLEERQTAAPVRKAIHDALRDPQRYYESSNFSEAKEKDLGTVPSTEDTCTAYQLFDEDQSCTNLVDWFLAFECVKTADDGSSKKVANKKDRGNRMQLMGRFSQSLQDLQFIGMIKSSRRRKGDHAQRNIFMPVDN